MVSHWKSQETEDIPQKLWQTQMTLHFSQIHQLKPNPFSIAESKQQEALTSTGMWLKQSACVLNKKEPFSLKGASL